MAGNCYSPQQIFALARQQCLLIPGCTLGARCLSESTTSTFYAAYEILTRPKGLILRPIQSRLGRTVAKVNDGEEQPIVPATTVLKMDH